MAASFKIVVNYRREDTAGHAGRLYDDLAERFGEESIFMDIDAIPPGVDFAQAIEQAIGSAQAFLALIGPRWIGATDASGARRLEQPGDFVRLEIEAALGSEEMLLIPVLFQGAPMPGTDQLPPSLAGLTRRNAFEIRNSSWSYDVARLIRALEEGGGDKAGVSPRRRIARWRRNRRAVWLAVGATLLAALGLGALAASLAGGGSGATVTSARTADGTIELAVEEDVDHLTYGEFLERTNGGDPAPGEAELPGVEVRYDLALPGYAKDAPLRVLFTLERESGAVVRKHETPARLDADRDTCACTEFVLVPAGDRTYRVRVAVYRPGARKYELPAVDDTTGLFTGSAGVS